MNIRFTRSDVREGLVRLYLRLNGYFCSGFIIHTSGEDDPSIGARTEIDVLGLRFPYHQESVRQVEPSATLEVSFNKIDLIIGEVKGDDRSAQFYPPLSEIDNIEYLMRWVGFFTTDDEILEVSQNILSLIQNLPQDNYAVHESRDIQIRPIIFHLGEPVGENLPKYISADEIISFIFQCLRIDQEPHPSKRRYNYQLWGPVTEQLVRYFKQDMSTPVALDDIYSYLEEHNP